MGEYKMLICDKCGGKVNEGFQFCPHCGDPITKADVSPREVTRSKVLRLDGLWIC